jgi:hypothetical protein
MGVQVDGQGPAKDYQLGDQEHPSTREWWGTDLLVLAKRRAVDGDL